MVHLVPARPGPMLPEPGFEERFQIPVMVRLVTRLAHSRTPVRVGEAEPEKPLHKVEDAKTWMLLPALARIRWEKLLGRHVQPWLP